MKPKAEIALALALGLSCTCGVSEVKATQGAAPVVPACSDPFLPAEILNGPFVQAHDGVLPLITAEAPAATLRLAVASDEPVRELGLMCVTRLRPQHGMIFVFPHNGPWEFWMKNTLIPLDMVWLDGRGVVTTVAERVPAATRATPESALARRRGVGRFVLELPAGEAVRDGVKPGAELALPPLQTSQ